MTTQRIPDLGIKGPWEPHQNMYNLLLNLPDFQLRALAQLFLNSVEKAELWLTYSDEYRITLVSYQGPTFPSSVYLPYLYDYALCVTNGVTPPDPDMATAGIFDITASPFNGVGSYVSPSDHGFDNSTAIDLAIAAASQAGGGIVLIPGGNFYTSTRHVIPTNNIIIAGVGKGVSFIYHEATDYDGSALFRFTANDIAPQTTTLYRCGIVGLSIRGDNPDLMSVAAANARVPKIAAQGVCTSGLILDFDLNTWNTGSDNYPTYGGSIGYLSQGKELTYLNMGGNSGWNTDVPIKFEVNPKEPGNQIDCDVYQFSNLYLISSAPSIREEYLIQIDPGLVFTRFKMTGNNVGAGGIGGIKCVEEIGEGVQDMSNIVIESFALEQTTANANGATINIQKKGGQKLVGFDFSNIACADNVRGLVMNGWKYGRIGRGIGSTFGPQAGLPMGITMTGVIKNVSIEGFVIPSLAAGGIALISLGGATISSSSGDAVTSGTEGNQLATRAIYNL